MRFQRYTIDDGLSQTTVRSITQDQLGMMWFGTQDGLNRFDGYEFRSFYRDSELQNALSDNHIQALLADPLRNGIWIGTLAGGLNFFDLRTEKFTSYTPKNTEKLLSGKINDLLLHAGVLWLATDDGLSSFSPTERKILASYPIASGASGISVNSRGDIAVAHLSGVSILSNGSLKPLAWDHGPAQVVMFDSGNHLWVGLTHQGLLHFSDSFALLETFRAGNGRDQLPGDEIRVLRLTSREEIWIGTTTGVAHYGRESGKFVRFLHDSTDEASVPANRSHAIFEDRDQQIWVGTWSKGVAFHNPQTRAIEHARQQFGGRSLPANPVRTLALEPDGTLWLGVLEKGGLIQYDFDRGVLQQFEHDPADPSSLSNNGIQKLLKTKAGELWVATSGGGINRMLEGKTRIQFERFGMEETGTHALPTNHFITMLEDFDGTIWAGSDNAGLLLRCKSCEGFVPFVSRDGKRTPLSINAIYRAKTGLLWVGTHGAGLLAINTETKEMRTFTWDPTRGDTLSHNSVTCLFERMPNELWAGTQGGGVNIIRLNGDPLRHTPTFQALRKSDGLGSDAIGSIEAGIDGILWIGTTVGISNVDPKSNIISNLTESAGLGRSGYYIGASAHDDSGRIMFGGLDGLIRFNPLELAQPAKLRAPVLTGLRVSNIPVKLDWQAANSPLKQSAPFMERVVLNHLQSMWSVEFSSLSYGNSDLGYQYRLLGLSDDWLGVSAKLRNATFTNLQPGPYTFEVRSMRKEVGGPITRFDVQIVSSPWQTPLAKLGYLCTALCLITVLFARARARLQERAETLARVELSENQLKNALWGSRDELWDFNFESGAMQSVNPIANLVRGTFAPEPGEQSARTLSQIAHPEDRQMLELALLAHMNGGAEFFECAFRMRTLQNKWCWVLSRGRVTERDESQHALRMVGTLRDVSDLKDAEEELRRLNEQLESRVNSRTEALSASNSELSKTLADLRTTQRQLVDSEKMASLGNLVAGVAHEINTPLGIGVTAASHLRQETERLTLNLEQGKLTKTEIQNFATAAVEASDLVLKNLDRASKLVRSFKQVAVDQGSEQRRTVVLLAYLEEVLFALKPTLRRVPHQVILDVPSSITMDTFPGAIWQVVFNLVNNALAHAFPEGFQAGEIRISAVADGSHVNLQFKDNGVGMSEDVRRRVFEPFFTTKRGQGGSGLGMHISYNLVTQLLKGEIRCESAPNAGACFVIRLPLKS